MPKATSASKKSRELLGCSPSSCLNVSASHGPLANAVKSPSSMALSNALDPQNPMPRCMIFAGERRLAIGCPFFCKNRDRLRTARLGVNRQDDQGDKTEEESERIAWIS